MADREGIERLAAGLSAARQRKRLTQRALSERLGMPQSHLSKIESGAVDVRVSSLIDLARALDLEVVLVPQRLMPAIQAMSRDDADIRQDSARHEEVDAVTRAVERLSRAYSGAPQIERLLHALQDINRVRITDQHAKQIDEILSAIKVPKALLRSSAAGGAAGELSKSAEGDQWLKKASAAADGLRRIRNALAHGAEPSPPRALPAYRLSDGDDDA